MIRRGRLFAGILLLGIAALASAENVPADDDLMVQTYRKAVAIDPSDVIAQFNLGLALYKLDRSGEARDTLLKCLETNRADAKAHKQVDGPALQILGTIYFNNDRDDRRAVEAFTRSLQLLPNDADTYYALGLAHQRLKDHAAALADFDQAARWGRGQDPEVLYQRGAALIALGRDADAASALQAVLKLKPDFVPALEDLALVWHRRGKDDEAAPLLVRLLKQEPDNFNANYLLGLHYYQKKMYPEMVAAYTKVIAVKPDLADAHYNLGMAYYYQGKYDLAVEELKKASALNPNDAEAVTLLGQAQTAALETTLHAGSTYLAQEKYREAVAEFKKVQALDPNNARARTLMDDAERLMREGYATHMRQADKFYSQSRLEDAYNEYDLAAALNPDSAEAQEGRRKTGTQMGKLLSQKLLRAREAEKARDYAEAWTQYTAALQLKPEYAPAKTGLAALRASLRAEAKKLLAAAKSATAKDQLAQAAGQLKRAQRLLEVLKDDDLQVQALSGLTAVNARRTDLIRSLTAQGKKLAAAGSDAKAKEAFNQVLKLDPQNKTANEYIVKLTGTQSQAKVTDEEIKATYYKGVDCYVNGKIEEAIQQWEMVLKLDPENQDARVNITRAKVKLAAIRKLTEGN